MTFDVGGPGISNVPHVSKKTSKEAIGIVMVSDDRGESWKTQQTFPFWHARPFAIGTQIYILGNAGDLFIIRSDDDDETWSVPHALTSDELWHGSATGYVLEGSKVYICMDKRSRLDIKGWNVAGLTPVVLRGNASSNLLNPESWTFSNGPSYADLCPSDCGDFFGVPFYPCGTREPAMLECGRVASPPGWLEGNVVRISDARHIWHDSTQSTLHLFLRANTNGHGYAAVVRAVEKHDGSICIEPVSTPSGRKLVHLPMPGGSLKFYISYDAQSAMYWLACSVVDDSMCKISALPEGRHNLPSNQRNKLGLYFSRNCVDWMFAGMISQGNTEREARNYPSFIFDNDDLLIAARSGDTEAKDGQYTNLITLHRVLNFRSLLY
ncbi:MULTISPECIES: hypothetical protein [unclassified Caballeronia]|uniref:hypothetical protein n=1 Tax=unclassified Caballeronia TaxID=2646786 RepID=UPI0028621FE1|nr:MULTISPECIES: hypothetical protein [unclassified Caballeronia]MDR5771159.1 hypothetical protein [Caballeronia sp. LZ002]MDR5801525.1 hypothetical protein [Caballeronia sp. LZ001]MDR5846596.1 hypothetical protein [Caballeronia sp. LZ003]